MWHFTLYSYVLILLWILTFCLYFPPHQTSIRSQKLTSRRKKEQSSNPLRCSSGWATKENQARATAPARRRNHHRKDTFSSKRIRDCFNKTKEHFKKDVRKEMHQVKKMSSPLTVINDRIHSLLTSLLDASPKKSLQWLFSVAFVRFKETV